MKDWAWILGGRVRADEHGRVSLRMLVAMRWIAVAGQAVTLVIVHALLGFTLPLALALGVVAAAALINIANSLQKPGTVWLGDRDAMLYLSFDVVQVAALLYLTGGLANPFALLLLAPVTVGASFLSRGATATLATVTVVADTVLAIWHQELPWDEDLLNLPALYVLAVWLALTSATVFIAGYTWKVAEQGRRMSAALGAAQMALARQQRATAVGALAAAAAHELGSPLATIAVVAKELARDLPPGSPFAEDAQLLLSQTARCRTILAELSQQREADGGVPFQMLLVSALVEAAGEPYALAASEISRAGERPPQIVYETEGDPENQPAIPRSPEIIHGLGNIIQNALQFARDQVEVMTAWDADSITVEVADDGPGFPPHVLARLGEPYLSGRDAAGQSNNRQTNNRDTGSRGDGGRNERGRADRNAVDGGGHMGLGIFIAQTLLQHTGATLEFANAPNGGAAVRVTWRRRVLKSPDRRAVPVPIFEESPV